MTSSLFIGIVASIVTYLFYKYFFTEPQLKRLPPGPKPWPILGNIRDLPPKGTLELRHWLKHKDLYGPISCVRLLGHTIVVIHDRDAAHDVLTKHSSKSSSRPTSEFATNLCGYGRLFVLRPDDKRFRRCRKMVHQHLGTKISSAKFDDVLADATGRFLLRVLNDPADLFRHVSSHTGGTVLRVTYGYAIGQTGHDPLIGLIERSAHELGRAIVPGSWLVDFVPPLRHLPTWFPGAAFKKTAQRFRTAARLMAEAPYEFVLRQMAAGSHRQSFVSKLVEQQLQDAGGEALTADEEDEIKTTAAVMYLGGADTLVTTFRIFLLCMILFPEVQRKAQEEIDRVLGPNQVPSISDRERLPYIEGIVKEAYRWSPVTPLGLAHATSEEIECNGYVIPAGATIMPAVWWFCHDPEVYREPYRCDPERYLEPRNERDPRLDIFGFGRRICVGRYLADTLVFLTAAQLLALFHIGKAIDEEGREVEPELDLDPGVACFPKEFPYAITPRTAAYAEKIRSLAGGRQEGDDSQSIEIKVEMDV